MAKTKTRRFRGSKTNGRGKKAGRGAGLRGGRGNAGMNKHHVMQKILIERATGRPWWGRVGFKRPQGMSLAKETTNVGRLDDDYPGEETIDLAAAGIDKLLGAGSVRRAVTVRVPEATPGAIQKVEAAGGRVELLAGDSPPSQAEE